METSPRIPVQRIGELMFSNRTVKSYGDAEPDVLMPKEENPCSTISEKSSFGI